MYFYMVIQLLLKYVIKYKFYGSLKPISIKIQQCYIIIIFLNNLIKAPIKWIDRLKNQSTVLTRDTKKLTTKKLFINFKITWK